ncbi:polynucleotide kinase-phosphatase [Leucobacter luti]|uniref:Polynucleotide 3'-phosphatase /polynucleotide 5'-hydroxyl-kinase /polynucleotide 2',3'-cyclic phosphate phosphodiesterase n=1 Tax=Leucobacter luti TaxID=340320 RepID=A0A4Q7TG76_9MICO|nr:polynucleotide kinase-phosphatase [Leucobacter luti]MBL3699695.1 polynucleotide kinase-phosphatase [Leucobacter luti]RZT59471.1 polynucleotide 3'-phosphatase /polynucleotide 5'-hydroxyl-kinase /polynucleotide 2',3'-cyclic phosphate phosphodiesterase [Leucobacter luti]
MTEISLPEVSLVLLIGASGSGKTRFARAHFGRYETVSSDECRGLVSNDPNDQAASAAAFEVLHTIAGKRLAAGLLTVIDATNVQKQARASLIELARAHDVLPVAIVFDLPEPVLLAHDAGRDDTPRGARVIGRQRDQLRRSLRGLRSEGLRGVHVLSSVDDVAAASVVRRRLLTDHRDDHGPFDAIGDVHGCLPELELLLTRLGYEIARDAAGRAIDAVHPEGRRALFLGDLVDRGPDSVGVLRLAMGMTAAGHALAVPGNHEDKLVAALEGKRRSTAHGLAETLLQLAGETEEFRRAVIDWVRGLVSHLVLDDGKLVVAHAGLREAYHGRSSGRVRAAALYGETTGEQDEYGLPVRLNWAADYRGAATVLHGHTPVSEARWVNNVLCLDTGCAFGRHLSALRYPEREIVQVAALARYADPIRPLAPPRGEAGDAAVVAGAGAGAGAGEGAGAEAAPRGDSELRWDDVLGRRSVQTRLHGGVRIREEFAAGGFETLSRFAISPNLLPYLPPTMAPAPTSTEGGFLEHPSAAFAAYRAAGVARVVCEEKHMGSRATVLLCRDAATAARRFGAEPGVSGAVTTRTGRAFFGHDTTEELLARLRDAASVAGLWDELETDWILCDGELLPWSLKARDLLTGVYAPAGAAAEAALSAGLAGLAAAAARGVDVAATAARVRDRRGDAAAFTRAYRQYVAPTDGLTGVSFAPFQVLATEGRARYADPHPWHLGVADRLHAAAPELIRPTRNTTVVLGDPESEAAGTAWWLELTAAGGEGMVVKPEAAVVRGPKGLVPPGLKVRGQEYLRIIYGPEYLRPGNLSRLRERNLGRKRALALQEFALGAEALDRLVAGEPLWRIHEAVAAVLALESDPVDPRL